MKGQEISQEATKPISEICKPTWFRFGSFSFNQSKIFFGFCKRRRSARQLCLFDNFNDLNGIYKRKIRFFVERTGIPTLQLLMDLPRRIGQSRFRIIRTSQSNYGQTSTKALLFQIDIVMLWKYN